MGNSNEVTSDRNEEYSDDEEIPSEPESPIREKIREVDYTAHEYPFENIALEGGGAKGLAYCGAVRVLEEIGAWENIKRISGTSIGAVAAMLLSVGYNSYETEKLMDEMQRLGSDSWLICILPNILWKWGWVAGDNLFDWLGKTLAKKTGNPDATFLDLYKKSTHLELCVIVTNLNLMSTEHCHVKTTPNMPVRIAVKMSISIPGVFQANQFRREGNKDTDCYVDGGVLCNYPIHSFDGWWLSMRPEDRFFNKMRPLSNLMTLFEKRERFGTTNDKTLGITLYADHEPDIMRIHCEKRIGRTDIEYPDTPLAREYKHKHVREQLTSKQHKRIMTAGDALLKVLNKSDKNEDDYISPSEFEDALKDESAFTAKHAEVLFHSKRDPKIIFKLLDTNKDNMISYQEVVQYLQHKGVRLQEEFLGYRRENIDGVVSYFGTLMMTLLVNAKRVDVEDTDVERTVGINTGHIGTVDFEMHPNDIEFLLKQGRASMIAFLKHWVAKKELGCG